MRSFMVLALVGSAVTAAAYGCGGNDKVDNVAGFTTDSGTLSDGGPSIVDDAQINGLDDASKPTTDAPTTCATTSAKAEVSPVDMYVMLDRSYSMYTDGKWDSIVNAVSNVVYNQNFWGMGVGLQYFPLTHLCTSSAYATPDVPITTLPQPAQEIVSSLHANNPWGNTPMVPALQGAVDYTKNWQQTNPSRTTVIVLATDGLPDESCQFVEDGGTVNSLPNVVQIASDAANGTPPIKTFVIGVGDALTDLNQIAAAGGTTSAVLVNTLSGVEQQFADALNTIRKRALSCDYVIPASEAGTIDNSKVNVRFTPNDGSADQNFIYVQTLSNCDKATGGAGWYYDDEAHPTRVQLCPNSCATAKASTTGQIDILFGCEIQAAPDVPIPK